MPLLPLTVCLCLCLRVYLQFLLAQRTLLLAVCAGALLLQQRHRPPHGCFGNVERFARLSLPVASGALSVADLAGVILCDLQVPGRSQSAWL